MGLRRDGFWWLSGEGGWGWVEGRCDEEEDCECECVCDFTVDVVDDAEVDTTEVPEGPPAVGVDRRREEAEGAAAEALVRPLPVALSGVVGVVPRTPLPPLAAATTLWLLLRGWD